jgi:glycosyltransferase involved in cell wall biosynthesis
MLKDIVEKLTSKHTVSVLTTDSGDLAEKKSRKEWSISKDISVQALSLGSEKRVNLVKKAFNSLYFGFWVFYKLLTTKTDVVMVATTPPVIIAMIVRWASYLRGFKYVYHCQDIHPEGMLLGGNIQKGFKHNTLLNIDKKNINAAWKVITLSEDMKQTLVERECKTSHVNIINNFIFESDDSSSPLVDVTNNKLEFLFAGSLGRLQNLDVLMQSLVLLKHRKDLHFTFMGDGIMFNEMTLCKEQNKLDNVEFLGQRSLQEAVTAMQVADIGIVSIGANISSVAYPSKTIMYLGNGLPILALVDKGTEIFDFINNNKIGKAIEPTSAKHIAEALEIFVDELKEFSIDKSHVKNIAKTTFSKNVILPKFLDLYS